jgi:LCP family protein required for cell wall assembly
LAALLFAEPGPRPSAASVPVIELHRTAQAAYFDPAKARKIFVLVIGSDVRNGDPRGGRADSLHIVSINTQTGSGAIVGIPRDSWVPVVGGGTQKINASLVVGGPLDTVATVSRLTGITFQYWALTEFSHFRRLVDRLGGVDVVVPYAMQDLKYSGANFPAGRRHMTGADALALARNRHATPNGDFSRSENQGRILLAGLARFRADATDPLKLGRDLLVFRSDVLADVPPKDLITLAFLARSVDPAKIRNIVLPGSTGTAGGASVVFLSPSVNDIFRRIRQTGTL